MLGFDLLQFVSRNIDNVFIGRFIGPSALGIYTRAYFLMLQPLNITNQVLARVMFPVFSSIQHDLEFMRRAYLKSTRLVSFVIFPGIVYVFVMAGPLITVLMGEKWLEVAFLLQVFCVYAIIDTIGMSTAWIYKSIGRTDILFRWGIYSTIVIILSIIAGLNWGIKGVAVSYTCAFLVFLWIPGWYFAFRLINLKVGTMIRNLAPVFVLAVLAGLSMQFLKFSLEDKVSKWLLCLLVFMGGGVVYWFLAYLLDKKSFPFFQDLIKSLFRRVGFFRSKELNSARN